MSTTAKEPFVPGDLVVADYRVPPFLTLSKITSVRREGAAGWLDASTLHRRHP